MHDGAFDAAPGNFLTAMVNDLAPSDFEGRGGQNFAGLQVMFDLGEDPGSGHGSTSDHHPGYFTGLAMS